jgi:hypothetical protein
LEEDSTFSILENVGNDGKQIYHTKYYNLDVVLSVGYRIGASLKDLGKKMFAFSKMELKTQELLHNIVSREN